jgi:hypothetical protein
MILRDLAFAIINNQVNYNPNDLIEAFQFVVDVGLTEELTAKQLLFLRGLIESDKVHTPVLWMPL